MTELEKRKLIALYMGCCVAKHPNEESYLLMGHTHSPMWFNSEENAWLYCKYTTYNELIPVVMKYAGTEFLLEAILELENKFNTEIGMLITDESSLREAIIKVLEERKCQS